MRSFPDVCTKTHFLGSGAHHFQLAQMPRAPECQLLSCSHQKERLSTAEEEVKPFLDGVSAGFRRRRGGNSNSIVPAYQRGTSTGTPAASWQADPQEFGYRLAVEC